MPASKIFQEFKEGTLHSGSKSGPLVTNRNQAIAIAMSYKKGTLGVDKTYNAEKPMAQHLNSMKSKGMLKSKKVKPK